MSDQASGAQNGQSNPMPVTAESPGGRPMGALGITLITIYLILVTIVVFHSLVVLWPPIREAMDDDTRAILERIDKLEKAQAGQATAPEARRPERLETERLHVRVKTGSLSRQYCTVKV